MVAKVKEQQKEREELTLRIAERNRATTQRLAKEEAEMEVKMRAKMEAELEKARAELRSEFAIDRERAMGELHKEYLASGLCTEAFNKCVAKCVELKVDPPKKARGKGELCVAHGGESGHRAMFRRADASQYNHWFGSKTLSARTCAPMRCRQTSGGVPGTNSSSSVSVSSPPVAPACAAAAGVRARVGR